MNEIQRESLLLKWNEADFFERSNENLYAFAPSFGLNDNDVLNIFKNYG